MRRRFLLSVLVSDLLALAVAFVIAGAIVFGKPLPWDAHPGPNASLGPLIGLVTAGLLIGSYLSVQMWAQGAPRPSYGRALTILGFEAMFAAVGVVLFRPYFSRSFLAVTLVVWLAGASVHRAVRRRRPWTEALLLITPEKGLIDDLRDAAHADVIGVFDPSDEPPSEPVFGCTLVPDLRPVMADRMAQYISSWNLAGYPVRALSTVYEEHTGRLPMVHLAEGWELSAPVARNEYAAVKRGVDVVLVIATAPIWIALAALLWVVVWLDSKGPAIYRQERVGRNGDLFTLYKFRTMVNDAENDGPQFTTVGDSRLTRSGRVLRRFRIDEIPQLWNVLKGEVSLVGPRPERPVFTEQYEHSIPFYGYRHLVRPGLTGWAQVNFGYADNERDTIEKLTYDLYYIKHMSPWLDFQILGRSLWTVLSGFGAQ